MTPNENGWDFNDTQLTVYFGDIPINQTITLVLPNWHEELKNIPDHRKAIFVSAYCTEPITLLNGVTVKETIVHKFGFWYSIYEKWKYAPKQKLECNKRVMMKLKRFSTHKWSILSITSMGV